MTDQIIPGKHANAQSKKAISIVFEDEDIVVINKPAGMLSIPDRTQSEPSLKDLLIEKYGQIFTVHRLDRETSGIVLFAKNETAHKFYSAAFELRSVEKYYLGLVHGVPANVTGSIDGPISEHLVQRGLMVVHKNGKPSLTDYELVEKLGKYSLVKFRIHTGRTHQIRVHAKHIGHPIACDPLYGDGTPILLSSFKKRYKLSKHDDEEKPILSRVALHSFQLKFKDMTGNDLDLTAELPKDIRALMQQLKKNLYG